MGCFYHLSTGSTGVGFPNHPQYEKNKLENVSYLKICGSFAEKNVPIKKDDKNDLHICDQVKKW